MEQTCAKKQKLSIIFTVIIAALLVAYIAVMMMPLITYTRLQPAEVAGTEESVSLMEYLWLPYNYADLTGDVLPDAFKAELGVKYTITGTIWIPLFSFLVGIISLAVVVFFRKKVWPAFFSLVWSFVTLIGYLTSSFLNLSLCNSTTRIIHLIVIGLTLVVSLANLFMITIPQMRYDAANKEKI